MKYYTYRDNGDYRGFTNLDIQPHNSTEVAPLEQEGSTSNWNGTSWDLVVIESGLTEAQNSKILELSIECESQIISGFLSSALGSIHSYQSNRDDQSNLMGLVIASQDDYFKCSDSVTWEYRLHTSAQLLQVLQDGKDIKLSLLQNFNTKKEAVFTCSTQKELDLIIF